MTPYLGVYCDGPFCINKLHHKAIEGVLFRCVECPDTDFCASCVLAPHNLHSQSFHGHLVFRKPPELIQWRSEYEELSDALCEKEEEIEQLVQCISAAQKSGGISLTELTNVAELLKDVQFLIKQASCTAKTEMPLLWDSLQVKFKPGCVYHVQYPGAWNIWSEKGGVQTPGYQLVPPTNLEFRSIVEDHISGAAGRYRPFVSLFMSENDAMNLALEWSDRHMGQPAVLLTVETASLERLYSLKELMEVLEIHTSGPPARYDKEYLVLHQIPAAGILQSRTITGSSNLIWPMSNGSPRFRCKNVDVDADKLAQEFDKSLHLGP